MNRQRNIVLLVAVAGLAYTAGQLDLRPTAETAALAVQPAETPAQPDMEGMDEAMLAWMEAGTPGKHHELLDTMIGTWEGAFHIKMDPDMPAMESTGTATREWVLGGRFVRETIDATSMGGEYHAIGYVGYDNIDGLYTSVWMDNMSTSLWSDRGSYDPENKEMTFRGSYRDPATGHVYLTRTIVDMSRKDVHELRVYETRDGQTFVSMEGTMRRKK